MTVNPMTDEQRRTGRVGTATVQRAATDRPRTADVFAVGELVTVARTDEVQQIGSVVAIDSLGVTIASDHTIGRGETTPSKHTLGIVHIPWGGVLFVAKMGEAAA